MLTRLPKDATHWSVRGVAAKTALSKSTVQRYFQLFGVQPHRTKGFQLSPDPFFIEKVRDVVGLYLNPPDKALVLCVDEKSQIQALERTQPNLPLGLGYVGGLTHNYTRHGTTTLVAALEGHLILDNDATHKPPKARVWLARHGRYHVHFTPTYASSPNQVEIWFGLISRQAIRRGSFRAVRRLVRRIANYVERYNRTSRPFAWTATAASIVAKLGRLAKAIDGTRH